MPQDLPPIGWLRHNFLPPSETFIHAALQALVEQGVRIRVLAINRKSEAKFPHDDVTVLNAPPLGWVEVARYWLTGSSPRQDAWAGSVALIHAHMGYTAAHALGAARRHDVPLVTSFYGRDVTLYRTPGRFYPQYLPYALLRRRLFEQGARFLVLSEHMKRELVAQGCPEEKIRIVRIGIDTSRFVPRPPSRSEVCTVLMVGREIEKKGFDDGMRACALARDRGARIRLVLLGTGAPLAARLRALADELDLPVEWPDPRTRVPQAMQEADILLVPSRTAENGDQEGTPTVICEGSASGLPVVATRHAGIPDQVDHERTGLLVEERDVGAMAEAITRLAADPDLRARYGRAGREKILAEFSIQRHRDGLLAVYRELLSEAAPNHA